MIELNQKYERDQFLNFLKEVFLNDFQKDVRAVGSGNISAISRASTLGTSPALDLQVFEFEYSGSFNKRIALAKEAFQIMKQSATFQALAVFYSPENDDWRFSLMTANPQKNDKGNITVAYSNPRRYSFFLGPNAKVNTPAKFLIKKGMVVDFNDLKSRFSLEVVNKEFYKEISESFTKLVGGTRGEGRNKNTYESLLKLPSVIDHSQTSIEFAVRLIGRVIFCWFLKEKIGISGSPLMPKELLSLNAISDHKDYYHKILEPIFFEVLNKPIKSRRDPFSLEPFSSIPYLNGGLFSPHDDDFFSYHEGKQQTYHNTVVVPDNWLTEFFSILETYNFTIDENTSIDEELSIDPEMLGRIFENLLAEINPETGESARKSTGSYYTPRAIVDYMVDESLFLYLSQKTGISEVKLRAIISYDLSDDSNYPLEEDEKTKLVDAIERIKILDPACGSGAYPIGALQKIVFILQQIDPEGQFWFQKQIQHTSPEIKRVIEREFSHKNFDYIRKLGVIRENIYGVDIQSIAIEIARLRCFLTLVVDERVDDALENRGIEPLPNLDFKFVTANSLIGLPNSDKKSQMGLFEDTEGIKELREIRDMFFNASGTEREQLKLQFVQSQNKMFQRLIAENRRGHADLTTMLTTWDPFSHKVSSWFDPEWMFGIKDGFDVVLANPPYVFGGNKGISEDEKKYFKKTYASGSQKINLFSIFLEKGTYVLKENGSLIYIVPNTLLRVTSYSNIREYLVKNTKINEIIDLDIGIFENVTASTIIISLTRMKTDLFNRVAIKKGLLRDNVSYLDQNNFANKGYIFNIFSTKENRDIVDKLKKGSIRLGELASNIRFGVVITKNINDVVGDKQLSDQWKKFLEGNEIGQYYINYENRYLFYKKELLHRSRTPEVFETNKILIQRITGGSYPIKAALDTQSFYNKESIINLILKINDLGEYKYILGLLNSRLINWFYANEYTNESKLTVNLSKEYLSEIPIKISGGDYKKKIIELVDSILLQTTSDDYFDNSDKKSSVQENIGEIDKIIYSLYDLTESEIKVVEGKND